MSYIDDVFGPSGALAQRFKGYEPRAGQIAFARAVDEAVRTGKPLFAEAGTGTGKSLAYAVPTIYHATHGLGRVVLATANIALQEQLVNKDLPLLAEILPWKFEFALAKGINNYLCLEQYDKTTMKNGLRLPLYGEEAKVAAWGAETKKGDNSELDFKPSKDVWDKFSTTSDDCSGEDCEFYTQCHVMRAKVTANAAQIVVTNYKLLFMHYKVQELSAGEAFVLPQFDVAVLDEGHKAADDARDCFKVEISAGAVRLVGAMLADDALVQELAHERDAFFKRLEEYQRSGKYKIRLSEKNPVPWDGLQNALLKARLSYAFSIDHLKMRLPGAKLKESKRLKAEIRKLARRRARALELIEDIDAAMNLKGDVVHYLGENEKTKKLTLCSKPISVAKQMHTHLFSGDKNTVVTSATLLANNSFDFVAGELGAVEPKTLVAESPFAWGKQALLVLPQRGIPEKPSDLSFTQAVAQCCAKVVMQARGRTLCLFTSKKGLNEAYAHVSKLSYRVLKQYDMPNSQLIAEFKKDKDSVLMGVASFWAGIDVPGESLSCVFIDKLPFIPITDPILDALSERDKNTFMNYSVPKAIIEFKQGFGRLIRTVTDRGVVVCCDRRITNSNYGYRFINSLPPVLRSELVEDVGAFLDTGILIPKISSPPGGRSLFDTL